MLPPSKIERFLTGVYRIHCTITLRNYIGSASRCFLHRWNMHRHQLRHGNHHSALLQNAWSKYGEDAFVFSIVELCEPNRCIEREQYYIDFLKSADRNFGLNISPTAFSQLGVKRSEETLVKMRARKHTKESRKKMSEFRRGKKASDEVRAKMSKARKGKKHRQDSIEKMKARVFTEDHRKNLSAAMKGRKCKPLTADHRAKLSAAGMGRKHSPETIAKKKLWRTTPEIRAKMRAAWAIRRERLAAKP